MSRTLRLVLAGLAVPSLMLGTGGAAHAERWSAPDPAGDVEGWHYDPEPAPCGTYTDVDGSADAHDDITRLKVRHSRKDIVLTAGLRDLDPTLEQSVTFSIGTPRRGWELDVDRYRGQSGKFRVMTFLSKQPRDTEPDPDDLDECGGYWFEYVDQGCRTPAVFDLRANVVRVTLPRSCVKTPAWVRVGVTAFGFTYSEEPDDQSVGGFSDFWGVREEGSTSWLPPYGPAVAAPPGAQKGAPSNRSRVTNSSTGLRFNFVSSLTGFPIGTTAASAN